jgi:signal transduction histidine kinase
MEALIHTTSSTTSSSSSAPPKSVRVRRELARLQKAFGFVFDRRRALPLAIVLAGLASLVDAFTTAEAVFTLFYLVPIGIAVWFRSRRAGYVLVALCAVLSLSVDVRFTPSAHAHPLGFVLWNFFGELSLYLLFLYLLDAMKRRLATEAALRKETLTQLRHADRLTTVGRLAAGLAHELGTPLNVVAGKASLISSGRMNGEDAKKSAIVIEQQADRMTTIIRHLLDFARRGGTGRQPTDLHALAEETAELLRPLALKSKVTFACEGAHTEAFVNRAELQQVLSNLLTNAVHAMPKGGKVTVRSSEEAHMNVLRVIDEGEGIPLEILPRIFDPFFTTKDVGQGTGLGLSVVHGIVDDHGGTIEVESSIGRGTTFTLRIPRS